MNAVQTLSWEKPKGRCVIFSGRKQKGYGYIRVNGRDVRAHRHAWEIANRMPVPKGLCVCHKCDNPSCVNPDHLFVATHQVNVADRDRKGRAAKGIRHPNAKLDEALVRVIRDSDLEHLQIARALGMHPSVVCRARNRKTWKHVL